MTENEALEIVRVQAEELGLEVEKFHFLPRLAVPGSLDSQLTNWPKDDVWVISVLHDFIYQGLIDSGGSQAQVNARTAEVHWERFP